MNSDVKLAKRYISKADRARLSGIDFELSITSYRNLMRAKKCGYTGMPLTDPVSGRPTKATDRTIDRIDNSKGYIAGNVIAVSHAANQAKSVFENPAATLTIQSMKRMIARIEKLMEATK